MKFKREILNLAFPVIISNFLLSIVSIVDMIMIGRLGPENVAAVGISLLLIWFLTSIVSAITTGVIAIVARRFGEEKYEDANNIFRQGFIFSQIVGFFFLVFGRFGAVQVFSLMGAEKIVVELAKSYMDVVILSVFFLVAYYLCSSGLRASGDTKTPMKVDILVNIINIFLNYILIFGKFGFPPLGIVGAAIGTAIAYSVGGIILSSYLALGKGKIKLEIKRISLEIIDLKKILKIGIPTSIESIMLSFSFIVYDVLILKFGTIALSATEIVSRIESLSYHPGWGFSIAATTLVGQYLGMKKYNDSEKIVWEAAKLSLLFMGSIAILFLLFPSLFVRIFISDPATIKFASMYLRIVALSEFSIAIYFVLAGALRGAGETRVPLYLTALGVWGIRIPLAYILGIYLKFGIIGIWSSLLVDQTIRALIIIYYFRKGHWKRISL
jgi:putative MATE family efflux protein